MKRKQLRLEKLAERKSRTFREHKKWLEEHGVSPAQLLARKDPSVKIIDVPAFTPKVYPSLGSGFAKGSFKTTIMERRFKETPEVRKEIENKAKQVVVTVNKSGYEFVTAKADPKTFGRK